MTLLDTQSIIARADTRASEFRCLRDVTDRGGTAGLAVILFAARSSASERLVPGLVSSDMKLVKLEHLRTGRCRLGRVASIVTGDESVLQSFGEDFTDPACDGCVDVGIVVPEDDVLDLGPRVLLEQVDSVSTGHVGRTDQGVLLLVVFGDVLGDEKVTGDDADLAGIDQSDGMIGIDHDTKGVLLPFLAVLVEPAQKRCRHERGEEVRLERGPMHGVKGRGFEHRLDSPVVPGVESRCIGLDVTGSRRDPDDVLHVGSQSLVEKEGLVGKVRRPGLGSDKEPLDPALLEPSGVDGQPVLFDDLDGRVFVRDRFGRGSRGVPGEGDDGVTGESGRLGDQVHQGIDHSDPCVACGADDEDGWGHGRRVGRVFLLVDFDVVGSDVCGGYFAAGGVSSCTSTASQPLLVRYIYKAGGGHMDTRMQHGARHRVCVIIIIILHPSTVVIRTRELDGKFSQRGAQSAGIRTRAPRRVKVVEISPITSPRKVSLSRPP